MVRLLLKTSRMNPGSLSGPANSVAAGLADQTADGHARELCQQRCHRLKDHPTNIFEIDVNPVRARVREPVREIGRAVIDGCVEPEFALNEGAFLRSTGDADRAGAGEAGQLADQRPDRSARRGDHDGLARLGLADDPHAGISGEAGHAEHPEPCCHRSIGRIDLVDTLAVGEAMGLPPRLRQDDLALGIVWMSGLGDFGDALVWAESEAGASFVRRRLLLSVREGGEVAAPLR